jgi:arylsulfatase A-like enzyme
VQAVLEFPRGVNLCFDATIANSFDAEYEMYYGTDAAVMIRERRYKYVRPLIHDLEELYDMQQDPEELNNLAVKPEHRKTLMRLRALAIAELRRSKAGFVDRMPAVREFALKQ